MINVESGGVPLLFCFVLCHIFAVRDKNISTKHKLVLNVNLIVSIFGEKFTQQPICKILAYLWFTKVKRMKYNGLFLCFQRLP